MIGPAEIFTIFFVTLGPLKVLGPFAQRTQGLDDTTVRRIAVWAFVIATIAIVVGS
jgi:multiple antibiotic resistance protein